MYKVEKQLLRDCPPTLYQKLCSLNRRHRGLMRGQVRKHRKDGTDAMTFYIRDDDTVLGWALAFPSHIHDRWECHVYVRAACRHNGLGRKLVDQLNAHFATLKIEAAVFPWDYASKQLYKRPYLNLYKGYNPTESWMKKEW